MELTIIKLNDVGYIDSREVAEIIGKRHDNLLRDIFGYLNIISKSNALKIEGIKFFVPSTYTDNRGRIKPCYLLTKAGCSMVANKLTGEKGVLFTAAYVLRFEQLEAAERAIKANGRPRLSEFNTAVKNVLNGMSQAYTAPHSVMKFLCGVYEPLGIEVLPFHETDYIGFYTVTEIAAKAGIYSETGRPHGHAVAAIISKLDSRLFANHALAIPYGLVGVTFRYDWYIVEMVRKWLISNNNPHLIPHLNFDYHVYYRHQLSLLNVVGDDTRIDLITEDLDALCGFFDDCDACQFKQLCFEDFAKCNLN